MDNNNQKTQNNSDKSDISENQIVSEPENQKEEDSGSTDSSDTPILSGTPSPSEISEDSAKSSEPKTTETKSEADKASGTVEHTPESTTETDSGAKQTNSESSGKTSGALRPSEPTATEEQESEAADQSAQPGETPSETPITKPSDPPGARWYVVHTYSGHENKVAHTLKQRVESEHLEEKILDVLVPMQDKIEIKSGKKINVKEKIFPGYILVKMVLNDASWLAVRTTQGVTSFVGIGNKPTPISDAEVATIIKFTQTEAPMYKQVFAVSDAVKIIDGPFADFIGKIDSIDEEKGKVRILVSIFGRETPVELDFLQIKKI